MHSLDCRLKVSMAPTPIAVQDSGPWADGGRKNIHPHRANTINVRWDLRLRSHNDDPGAGGAGPESSHT